MLIFALVTRHYWSCVSYRSTQTRAYCPLFVSIRANIESPQIDIDKMKNNVMW